MKLSSYKALLGSLLLAAVISSCADREDSAALGKSTVNISAGVRSQAANGQWNTNDVIGIAMLAKNDQKVIAPYSNYGYKTNGDGNFTPSQADKIIYFPQDGSQVTFKSYYPYQSELGDVSAISLTVADQKDLPAIDFMSAEHVSGFTKADSKVELRFYHRLSKLIFNLKLEGGEELPVTGELVMKGMKSGATYNLMSETLSVDASTGQDITAGATADGIRTAIVMPRAAGEGVSFVFKTTDGRVYTALMDKTLKLEGGYKYTFNIVLKKTPIEVSAIIEDWIEAPAVNAHAICVSSEAGESSGVTEGDIMHLYNKEKGKLIDFTYTKNPAGGDKAYVWNPTTPIYWESLSKDKNTFYASIIGEKALNDTQLPDVLIAGDTEVEYNHGVDLVFKHAATKVIFKLNSPDGTFTADELKNATIVLPGYQTGGKEENGRFAAGTTTGDIDVFMTANTPEGTAIFDPQTIANGNKLAIVILNGRKYYVDLGKDFEFKAGQAVEMTLNMKKTVITVSTTVIDWITVTREENAIEVGTTVSGGVNVDDGEEMFVYHGDDTNRTLLTKYTYASAPLDKWTAETTCYWESLANPTTFYAFIKKDFTSKGVGLAYDYLTAKKEVASNYGIAFTFNHVSAQVKITLQGMAFTTEELEGAQIILPSYEIYDNNNTAIVDGVFKPVTQSSQDLTVKESDNKINSALIPAQTIAAGTTIARIIIKGRTYNITSTKAITYETGKTTHLKIAIDKTMVTVSAMVTEWIENPVELVVKPIEISTPTDSKDFATNNQLALYILGTDKKATYTFSAAKTWTADNNIYWNDFPDATTSINVAAVSTAKSDLSDIGTITNNKFSWTITDLNNSVDLLLTKRTVSFSQSIDLEFTHALSRVVVKLVSTDGSFSASELTSAENTVTLQNIIVAGTADIQTATVTAGNTPGSTTLYKNGNDFVSFAIPQEAIAASSQKKLLKLKIGTRTVDLTLSPSNFIENGSQLDRLEFKAGRTHTITVDLQKTTFGISATIKGWENGSSGSITIQ